jgi:hypothetical protein
MRAKSIETCRAVLAFVCAVGIAGCEREPADAPSEADKGTTADRAASLPADLFLALAPDGARGVGELKADDSVTGAVVVRGRIGGRVEPFVKGSAVFLLADADMKDCSQLHGDTCPRPWDYCCEPKDSLLANTATVQVVGDDGQPLRIDLAGRQGLEPLREIVVTGDVASRAGGSLVINARGIYVSPARS